MPNNSDPTSPEFRKRLRIASEASRWIGSHYLWGAAGAFPGNQNGVTYLHGGVLQERHQINDPSRVAVWACSFNVTEKQICCGRFRSVPGGREINSPQDPQLTAYLAQLQQNRANPNAWVPYQGRLFPRLAIWRDARMALTQRLVWGEDCREKRHFDCIHFINYVLIDCNVRGIGREAISFYASDANTEPNDKRHPWPGDIVTHGQTHIGFIYDEHTVVHAAESVRGVVREPYVPSQWARLGRLRDQQL